MSGGVDVKRTLTIELEDGDQDSEIELALKAGQFYCVIVEVRDQLRKRVKYGELPEDVEKALEEIQELLWEELTERGLSHLF